MLVYIKQDKIRIPAGYRYNILNQLFLSSLSIGRGYRPKALGSLFQQLRQQHAFPSVSAEISRIDGSVCGINRIWVVKRVESYFLIIILRNLVGL